MFNSNLKLKKEVNGRPLTHRLWGSLLGITACQSNLLSQIHIKGTMATTYCFVSGIHEQYDTVAISFKLRELNFKTTVD